MNRRELLLSAAALPLGIALAPRAAAARPRAGAALAFVTADLESHVAVVDPGTARVVARIRTPAGPRSIESIAPATALVAHTAHGRVSLVDGRDRRVRAVIEGFAAPRYTAAGRDHLAYVTDSGRGEVVTVDVRRARLVARASVPGPARHVTITPANDFVWTSLGSKAPEVAVLSLRGGRPRLERLVTPPFLAHDVVAAPDGVHVWVTSGNARRIAVYDHRGRRPLETIAAGAPPQHIAFVDDRVFVASGEDGTVRVHDPNGALLHEARVPVGSYNVTFGGDVAVTPSLDRGTVALLDERGRVEAVRTIARSSHDACVLFD
jgi:DNA-binding beta-propeller fold protein YncE